MGKKICKKCGNEFEPRKGLINYCSLQCRNSRTWTEEDKKKKRIAAKESDKLLASYIKRKNNPSGYFGEEINIKYIELHEKRKKHVKKVIKIINQKRKKTRKENIMSANYSDLKYDRLRERIFFEQNNCCNKCDNSEWLGEPIILELEHKDGNHNNNLRDNLEGLCPNCHAQTDTWRGRNKRNKKNKVSDEHLLESLINNNWNMRQSLLNVLLAPKGGNYKRCHKLKREYTIIVGLEGTAPSSIV